LVNTGHLLNSTVCKRQNYDHIRTVLTIDLGRQNSSVRLTVRFQNEYTREHERNRPRLHSPTFSLNSYNFTPRSFIYRSTSTTVHIDAPLVATTLTVTNSNMGRKSVSLKFRLLNTNAYISCGLKRSAVKLIWYV